MKFPVCGGRREKLLSKIPADYYQRLNANFECTQNEAQSIYNRFRELAPNGRLTLANFHECLGLFGSLGRILGERMFRAFDLNNNDYLDFVDFATALLIMTKGSEEDKLALSYRILHSNPQLLPSKLVSSLDSNEPYSRYYTASRIESEKLITAEMPPPVEEADADQTEDPPGTDQAYATPEQPSEPPTPLSFIIKTTGRIMDASRRMRSSLSRGISRSPNLAATSNYDTGIHFSEFLDFVNDIALTKALLVCREPRYYTSEEVLRVFMKYSSTSPEGVHRLTLKDYVNAVCESSEFLEFLGVSLSQYATDSVNQILNKLNLSSKAYINRTKVRRKNLYKWMSGGREKRGSSVHFGHESWNRVVNMMIGLSISARYVYSQIEKPPSEEDHKVKLCFNIVQDDLGLKVSRYTTKAGLSSSRFTDKEYSAFVAKRSHRPQARPAAPGESAGAGSGAGAGAEAEEPREPGASIEDIASSSSINVAKQSNTSVVSEIDIGLRPYGNGAGHRPHTKSNIVFKEYAPMVFRRIRALSGLSQSEYVESVSPEQIVGNMVLGNMSTMSELVSEGKSGALFYYTINGRLILKTITKDCAKFVKGWLRGYHEHLERHPHSILTRYYGLFSIENRLLRSKVYFVAMNNVFYSRVSIHRRYDLKGSWVGRSLHPSLLKDHTVALKDLDFDSVGEHVLLGERTAPFLETLRRDVEFLRDSNVLDYSLLLGIHYRDQSEDAFDWDAPGSANQHEIVDPSRSHVYYMGIVDLFTTWNLSKKLERFLRILQTRQHQGVSCVNPAYYSSRFIQSIANHFK